MNKAIGTAAVAAALVMSLTACGATSATAARSQTIKNNPGTYSNYGYSYNIPDYMLDTRLKDGSMNNTYGNAYGTNGIYGTTTNTYGTNKASSGTTVKKGAVGTTGVAENERYGNSGTSVSNHTGVSNSMNLTKGTTTTAK